jgi:hypothetical protein
MLRAALAFLWHPWEIAAAALIVLVDWDLPGMSWMLNWVYLSCFMIVMEIPFALLARSLQQWSKGALLKRFVWWVFAPDLSGEQARVLGCIVICVALVVRGTLNGQFLGLVVAFSLIVLAVNTAHETQFGNRLSALGQLQVDLRFRLAGNPPVDFPGGKRSGANGFVGD